MSDPLAPPAASTGPAGGWVARNLPALAYRDFRLLWAGVLFASGGLWVQNVTVGWLVYTLTGSSVLLGLLNGIGVIPWLFVSPVAGAMADRIDRRFLLLGASAVLVTAALIIGALTATGHVEVWHLYVFVLVSGCAWSVDQPVRQAMVGSSVPREVIANAVALNSAGFNLSRIVGPGVAGLMIAFLGAGGNFFVQAAAFAGVGLTVWAMASAPPRRGAAAQSVLSNMKAGFRWVWGNAPARMLMMLALTPFFLGFPFLSLMPIFAEDVLKIGPSGLGLLLAANGVGALSGAMLMAAVGPKRRRGPFLMAMLGCMGVSLVAFSLMDSLPVALLCLVVVGVCQMCYAATNMTRLQLLVPDEYRGRAMSIFMLNNAFFPLGSLTAGIVAGFIGAPSTVTLMGVSCVLLAAGAAYFSRTLRNLE